MTLSACAHVMEELAQGRRADADELLQAAIELSELLGARARGDVAPSADLVDAIGLIQHALQGSVPRLNAAGRARALRLAAEIGQL